MEEKEIDDIHQIFDSIFKKVITLSAKAVVHLINGLFDTDYPPDSTVDYNWTEFHDDKLKKTLADTIITINRRYAYHLEAQIKKDNAIVFRIFAYGFGHADRNRRTEDGEYIQTHTEELKEVEEMTDESFMTDIDILCEEYNKKIEQAQKEAQEAKEAQKKAQVQSEKDIKLALIKSIENVMKSFQCTLEEACKAVGSSLAEYNEAKQLQQ